MITDQRDEALRLAKEAGIYTNDTLPMRIDCERLARLIALARASAAPQEPVGCVLRWKDGVFDPDQFVPGKSKPLTTTSDDNEWIAVYTAPQPQAAPQAPNAQDK